MSNTSILAAENLTKRYGEVTALDSLTLEIRSGEIFCLLGANGAGKTTTVNLFLNFVQPTSGRAMIQGKDVTRYPLETKRSLAYIPETVTLYPAMTGYENLEFLVALSARRRPSRSELLGALDEAGLPSSALNRAVGTYSKGMRQKVGIAMAIAKQAEVLLLDEPTSGLDPSASNEFALLLRRLSERGTAILMVTHDLFRAKETGTRVGIMRAGRLVDVRSTEAVSHADLERIYLEHV